VGHDAAPYSAAENLSVYFLGGTGRLVLMGCCVPERRDFHKESLASARMVSWYQPRKLRARRRSVAAYQA
jgi:hypothetical protein